MKKCKKILLFTVLVAVFVCIILITNANAADIVDSGVCGKYGEDVTWVFDSDGTLTISGHGEMRNYSLQFTDDTPSLTVPWFKRLAEIKNIVINDGVKSIGDFAFYGCYYLKNVSISDSVKYIGEFSFAYCSNLLSVNIPYGVTTINTASFHYCYNLKSANIPDSVTKICYCAFSMTAIKSIRIPDSVTFIDDSAFNSCLIEEIDIPNSVNSMGLGVFENCRYLKKATVGKGLTSISDYTFSDCLSLEKVTISNTITSIGAGAFQGCSSLTDITIPNSVENIDDHAFSLCSSLLNVIMFDGITNIGNSAFSQCSNLLKIKIPDTVTNIGGYAFSSCVNLSVVTIPNSVLSIGNCAFIECSNLSDINVDTNNLNYMSENGVLFNKDKTILIQYPIGNVRDNYSIPNGVNIISSDAFYSCKNITNITLPDSIKSIGSYCFTDCNNINYTNFSGTIDQWVDIDFSNEKSNPVYMSHNLYINNQLAEDIIILNSSKIKNYAFYTLYSLKTVIISENVTSIGDCVFSGCKNLTYVKTTDYITSIGNNAFSSCSSLVDIKIPKYITKIDYGTFYNCKKIEEINIPDGVTSIGQQAFSYCSNLPKITLPLGLKEIGIYCFNCCYKLTDITIPDGISVIPKSAFRSCSNLKSIKIPDSVGEIHDYAFYNCNSLSDVYFSNDFAKWNKIKISGGNEALQNAQMHYASYEINGRKFYNNIDYFVKNLDSTAYDPELANILALLSEAEYSDTNAKKAYNELGFDNYQHYDFKGATNGVYSLGFKNSEYDGSMICLLTVRGSEPNWDTWLSNFNATIGFGGHHNGFDTVANNISDKLDTILKNTAYSKKDLKYVITGHSRGAAIANLLAYKLNKDGVSESNVYNYNFSCPDVACKFLFGTNNNIFNLCNRVDVVPYVPGVLGSKLATNGMSWGKYGRTYWFTEGEFNVLDPFATHHMNGTYMTFFDKRLNLSDWNSTLTDKTVDAIREITGVIAKILCPVDVVLKDRDGNTVVSVINNEVIYAEDASINVMVITKDDEKLLFIFGESNDFNIELVGTDEGEMTYAIEKYVLQNDEVIESKTFSNVKLEKGKQMYSPVSSAEKTDDVELFVVKEENGEKVFTHTINTDGSETECLIEHTHTYTPTVTSPTCTTEGYTTYTCDCGDSYVSDKVDSTNHKNAYGVKGLAATCTTDGYTGGTYCPDCEKYLEGHETLTAKGHHYNAVKTPPTCTNEGFTTYTCDCGDSYVADKINPTGHNNVNGKCTNCGHDFTNGCTCKCHSKGFTLFIWKIGNIFRKIFKKDKLCSCGAEHW